MKKRAGKMEELKCKNCGNSSFRTENGLWVCNWCGSQYIRPRMPEDDIPYYVLKAEEAFENKQYKKMNNYALKILGLDPEHAYAWMMRMYYHGLKGRYEDTDKVIEYGEKAVLYEKEDPDDTISKVGNAFLDWVETGIGEADFRIQLLEEALADKRDILGTDSEKIESFYWEYGFRVDLYLGAAMEAMRAAQRLYDKLAEAEKKRYGEMVDACEKTVRTFENACSGLDVEMVATKLSILNYDVERLQRV